MPDSPSLAELAPLRWISIASSTVIAMLIAGVLAWKVLARSRTVARAGTWDCGYARPTARMQYTGSSFAQMLVGLFAFMTFPRRREPDLGGVVPGRVKFSTASPDAILDRLVVPIFDFAGRYLPRLRVLQQGQTQIYVLYLLVAVIILFILGALGAQP